MENTPGKENFTYENYTYGKLYLWRIHWAKEIRTPTLFGWVLNSESRPITIQLFSRCVLKLLELVQTEKTLEEIEEAICREEDKRVVDVICGQRDADFDVNANDCNLGKTVNPKWRPQSKLYSLAEHTLDLQIQIQIHRYKSKYQYKHNKACSCNKHSSYCLQTLVGGTKTYRVFFLTGTPPKKF